MLRLKDYKLIFVAVVLVGVLLLAYPTLSLVVHLPPSEKFSELWILGSGHMAEDYPSNVMADENYTIYAGVANHLDSSTYYVVYVKLRNQTEVLPNSTAGTPSPLNATYEYHVFLQDGNSWEAPLTFSFSGNVIENQFWIWNLTINNNTFVVDKQASWDPVKNGYYYQLFLELWIYNVETETIQFHDRYVTLSLNMTSVS